MSILVAAVCASQRGGAGRLSIVAVNPATNEAGATPKAYRELAPGTARAPVFSVDGRWIAFERGEDVTLLSLGDPSAAPTTLAPSAKSSAGPAYQFDASGEWLALALERGVLVVPTAEGGGGRFVALPEGHRPERLLWSELGGLLAVSARETNGNPVAILIDPGNGRLLATSPGAEVLGVPDNETVWLVGPRAGLPWAEALVWKRGSDAKASFLCPEDHLILSWVPRRSAVLLVAVAEDTGDAADIAFASLVGGEPRPVIQGISGVRDVSVSTDGAYVTFLSEEDPAAFFLAPTADGDSAIRRIVVTEPGDGPALEADAEPES